MFYTSTRLPFDFLLLRILLFFCSIILSLACPYDLHYAIYWRPNSFVCCFFFDFHCLRLVLLCLSYFRIEWIKFVTCCCREWEIFLISKISSAIWEKQGRWWWYYSRIPMVRQLCIRHFLSRALHGYHQYYRAAL